MKKKFKLKIKKIKISACIGVSIYPLHGTDAKGLLKNSNIAMYIAKGNGKNTYQFCNPEMTTKVEERASLGYYLQEAISKNELMVYYQPKISLTDDKPIGVEALMRWRRSDGSLVYPQDFISLAEDSYLISALDEWLLNTVCKQIKIWQEKNFPIKNVAINISALEINEKFPAKINKILQETNVDPTILELEITESVFLKDTASHIETLKALKKLGVKITIDDFGTGFSSLGYIRSFPIDKVKIDQSFLKSLTSSERDSVIIQSIIAMAHELGFKVVAEGVETSLHVAFLKRYYCDEAQGFFYSKAVSAKELELFFNDYIKK